MNIKRQISEDIIRNRIEILSVWWLLIIFQIFNSNYGVFFITIIVLGVLTLFLFLLPINIIARKKKISSEEKVKKEAELISRISLALTFLITLMIILTTYSSADQIIAISFLGFIIFVLIIIFLFNLKFPTLAKNTKFLIYYSFGMLVVNIAIFGMMDRSHEFLSLYHLLGSFSLFL